MNSNFNAPASSSRPPNNDDLTWLDFLRTAGGTAPAERSSSTERKRRHAGSSPERRDVRYTPSYAGRRPSGTSAAASQAGNSREDAIDLISPPRQRPSIVPRMSDSGDHTLRAIVAPRTGPTPGSVRASFSSDVNLPKWQADGEVSRCPVCRTEFSFWYRKHHCRKCGRVVCAACSPHRITIPRQYIVQPPNLPDSERGPTSPPNSPYDRNLGGGEVVRVCNPCVPDPWTPDTASDGLSRAAAEDRGRRDGADGPQRPDRYRPVPPPPPFDAAGRARAQSHQPAPSINPSLPQGQPPPLPGFVIRDPSMRPPPLPPNHPRPTSHRHTQSNTTSSTSQVPPFPIPQRQSHIPTPSAPPQRPRREIREEDECPVCGTELPPGAQLRESHIQECIASRFSSTPSSAPPAVPPRSSSTNSTSTSHSSLTAPPPPTQRARATSYRPRGMAVYKATEKDCLDEDGEQQECVICFEEFQPGDEMGRMECLCKFHRQCIRAWWGTKGVGSCPTHMLHE